MLNEVLLLSGEEAVEMMALSSCSSRSTQWDPTKASLPMTRSEGLRMPTGGSCARRLAVVIEVEGGGG